MRPLGPIQIDRIGPAVHQNTKNTQDINRSNLSNELKALLINLPLRLQSLYSDDIRTRVCRYQRDQG
jgi:hypothetical protein